MNTILECKNLCKSFGKKEVLKDISFKINEGDILAFIGPNGSGKTTTIKLILGLQKKNKGEILINGIDIEKDYINAIKKVGAIVENPDMYMYLTGYQNLKLTADYYNVKKEKVMEIVRLVELEDRINEKVSKYSLGMRQRLGIARSLINEPNLLILDEPTNGLDPEGIKDLRDLLKRLAKNNIGILISSHNLAELESFCNKVCLIDKGHVLDVSDIKEFKNIGDTYLFKVSSTKGIKDNIFEVTDSSFIYKGSKEDVSSLIKTLVKEKIDIYEVIKQELTMEEAFLKKTGGKKRDKVS